MASKEELSYYTIDDFYRALWMDGQTPSLDAERQIREAGSITEAVKAATDHGLDVHGLPGYSTVIEPVMAMEQSNEIGDEFVDSALRAGGARSMTELRGEEVMLERHRRDTGEPIDIRGVNETVRDQIEQSRRESEQAIDATVAEFDPDEVLLTTLGGSLVEKKARLAAVQSDNYNPYFDNPPDDYERGDMSFLKMGLVDPGYTVTQEEMDYWSNQYKHDEGYYAGEELLAWSQLDIENRRRISANMEEAGIIPEGMGNGAMNMVNLAGMRQIMAEGTDLGVGYEIALQKHLTSVRMARNAIGPGPRPPGGGRVRAKFSVPASLRQIPDYESIEQEVHNLFRQRLGREAEDWEIAALADQMKVQYQDRNKEMIVAARAAFNQAQSGKSGTMEVEVPDPVMRSQKFIEERYGNELDRQEQITDTGNTNRLMIAAMTKGAGMIR